VKAAASFPAVPTTLRPLTAEECAVAVEKAVDLVGTGASIEEAVDEALDRAELTLEGITSFDVVNVSGVMQGSRVVYRVRLRVWFTLLERMHG
jgi:flavin-binding protein dodecin